ncbi:MAG: glutamate-1-semialdehyde 2,1-aminomutase, partial [Deltaproteobacteria bacterium]|nr:glutamate-1-semialdehyde 2,1-aminomutase [Deltaproteobacteria bacterium]
MKSGILKRAQKILVGGVNSPVRAFRAVGRDPVFISRGKGAKLYDVDGKSYIDYIMSWGPLISGHAHPRVLAGVAQALKKGTSFGATTPVEIELAERIRGAFPSMERVRLVNSGTEACMSVVRLARGYTKRKKIIKFEGCYHGHADFLLAGAGSGAATFGIPDSAGVPEEFARFTIVLPYNNLDMVKKTLERNGTDIAALILEPVVGNMGVVLPQEGFLKGLRDLCSAHGVLLIFDEVITGFRLSYGGAQKIYGIKPDLTCLGKIIGGGFPVGAYGGRKEIMECLSPLGPVYQAGTLAGNPVACTAG